MCEAEHRLVAAATCSNRANQIHRQRSNSLEEVDSGMIHSAQSVYSEYPGPRRDEWQTTIPPAASRRFNIV